MALHWYVVFDLLTVRYESRFIKPPQIAKNPLRVASRHLSSSSSLRDLPGILAMDVYFPHRCVAQSELETADGVGAGKYTIGLGQQEMAFCDDREDINSFCLSALAGLLDKYQIDPREIGRLEVGTETLVDKSKSTKTTLMSLMGDARDVEGATVINACYGGTAALLNSLAWVGSNDW